MSCIGAISIRPNLVDLFAFVWGMAEATLFFIVPDVLLTWTALERFGTAVKACAWCLLGALVGGTIMWTWGATNAGTARSVMDFIPSISSDLIAGVQQGMAEHGPLSMLLGPMLGTPYKIYAVEAGALQVNLFTFLVITIPARLGRFILLSAITSYVAHRIGPRMSLRAKQRTLLVLWLSFYVLYFLLMPN